MYLFIYDDGLTTQQEAEPTADDYESVATGAIDLVRVDTAGVFQIYYPEKAAWVDVITTK